LGWMPKVTLREGLEHTFRSFADRRARAERRT